VSIAQSFEHPASHNAKLLASSRFPSSKFLYDRLRYADVPPKSDRVENDVPEIVIVDSATTSPETDEIEGAANAQVAPEMMGAKINF
jgi:hypothetical protein